MEKTIKWLNDPAPRSWAVIVFVLALGAITLYGVQLAGSNTTAQRAQTASRTSLRVSHQVYRLGLVALQAASEAQTAITTIQRERVSSIRSVCKAQNQRHDNTIKELDQILRVALRKSLSKVRRLEIKSSRSSTILLINTLAPRQDCGALIAHSTSR